MFAKDLAIDEQLVPYYSRHTVKMFIRGKPIRFGYKTGFYHQVMATLTNLRHTRACDAKDSSKLLGSQVVSALFSIVENPACHCVYFDNFFTYYYLLQD